MSCCENSTILTKVSHFWGGLSRSNKHILRNLEFGFPLTLSFITLLFCSAVCWIYVHVRGVKLRHEDMITRDVFMWRICPIGLLSAGTIVLGMASYLFLTVAFVQMVKAFTPAMTLTGLVLFKLTKPSVPIVISVLFICIGTAIAGAGELNFSFIGISCMLLAQACEALKLIYTQMMLQNLRFDLVETLYYITPTSAVFVLLSAVFLEFPFMTQEDFDIIRNNRDAFATSCLFALSTNMINTFVIQFSGALVLKLTATARNAMLVLFNALVMGEVVTEMQFKGYSISLAGFLAYNYIKTQKGKHKMSAQHASSPSKADLEKG